MRVLIGEDEPIDRRVLEKFLQPCGRCDSARAGDEVLAFFKAAWEAGEPYDLVVLDIMLPELDGQEVLQRIRAFEREEGLAGREEAKVIMITALDDPKNVLRAFYEGGANAYLVKPIQKEELDRELEDLGLLPPERPAKGPGRIS